MARTRIDLTGTWRLGWGDGHRDMAAEPSRPEADDSLFIEAREVVRVYGVNDTPQAAAGELTAGFFHTHGSATDQESAPVTLPANASTLLRSIGGWQGEPGNTIAFATLRRPGAMDARSRLIRPAFGELDFAEPKLSVRTGGGQAVFESDTFVWGVCLDLSGGPAAANFFDVWPGMPYALPWDAPRPPAVLHTGNLYPGRS